MPNILSGTITGLAPTSIDVDSTSKTVVAQNYSRVGLVLMNLASGTVYIAFGTNSAVVGSGITLLPSGGSWSMDEYSYTKDDINAIAHSDNSQLAIQEFVNRA